MNESARELRRSFLDFFAARDHRVVPSAPLVPLGDPSLLFTTAGMVQFKPLYGIPDPDYRRAASVQKCLRATDVENVGRTIRHHTFFEMLGNFSFGDYFKEEAITWGWEYLTEAVRLPKERIWVSVHTTDDEAAQIWERETDLPRGRIVRLGDEHNFWGPAGAAGACGPSSEMYWDLGPGADPAVEEGDLATGDRYVEVWNLVFPQYNQLESGERVRLDHPGIDTGMGFERLCFIAQGVDSPYDTDLFRPIVAEILEMAGLSGQPEGGDLVAVRVIADHVRGLTFAMADGVVPSNEHRGYLLRRLLRRASRRGHGLGLDGPFLHRMVGTIVEHYGDAYPELTRGREQIERLVRAEEERFERTLGTGVQRFEAMVAELVGAGGTELRGGDAFQLYDTYGFPIDLTAEMAAEHGLTVDRQGFDDAMAEQRRRARARHRFQGGDETGAGRPDWVETSEGSHSEFRGYETLVVESVVRRYRVIGAGDDEIVELVLAETPFYAEAGGQVGDQGDIEGGGAAVRVFATVGGDDAAAIHRGRLVGGRLEALIEGPVTARVDAGLRAATMRNHTATHLLQAALRDLLGEHVRQAGSLVAPDRLRFDFTHLAALSDEEIRAVEQRVNEAILANHPVEARVEPYSEATDRGAIALFGEKYGREVRTIEVPGVSLELCGGTHCRDTGAIGLFKIVSESAIGAGMRRVEAVTGLGSLGLTRALESQLRRAAALLGVAPSAVTERLAAVLKENADLERQVKVVQSGDLGREVDRALEGAEDRDGHRLVVARLEVGSVDLLRQAGDRVRERLGSGAAVLGTVMNGKANFLAVVTDDLIAGGVLRADQIVRQVAQIAGGSGGGKPHQALAGGKRVDKLDEALEHARRLLRERLKGVRQPARERG